MVDLLYMAGTVAFFALMVLYVVGCDVIGRQADVERADDVRESVSR